MKKEYIYFISYALPSGFGNVLNISFEHKINSENIENSFNVVKEMLNERYGKSAKVEEIIITNFILLD